MIFLLLALAIAPSAAIIWYIYTKDQHEKEPPFLLLIAFALGVVSVVPALAGGNLGEFFGFGETYTWQSIMVYAFGVVALSEELAKFLFLRFVMYPHKEFNEPYDGIIYAVMIGMGFATFENLLYVQAGGLEVAILRMFTAVPAHAAFGVIMGYYVGLAKFDYANRNTLLLKGLLWAVLLHGAYDFFLMLNSYAFLSLVSIAILYLSIYDSKRAIAIHQANSPFHPENINTEIAFEDLETKKDAENENS